MNRTTDFPMKSFLDPLDFEGFCAHTHSILYTSDDEKRFLTGVKTSNTAQMNGTSTSTDEIPMMCPFRKMKLETKCRKRTPLGRKPATFTLDCRSSRCILLSQASCNTRKNLAGLVAIGHPQVNARFAVSRNLFVTRSGKANCGGSSSAVASPPAEAHHPNKSEQGPRFKWSRFGAAPIEIRMLEELNISEPKCLCSVLTMAELYK